MLFAIVKESLISSLLVSIMDSRNLVMILYISAFVGLVIIVALNETVPNFVEYCLSKMSTCITKPVIDYIKQILYPNDNIHSSFVNSEDDVPQEDEAPKDNEHNDPDPAVLPPTAHESSSPAKIHHLSSLLPHFRVDMESIDLRTQDSEVVHEFFKFFCAVTIIKIYMDHISKTQGIFTEVVMHDNKHKYTDKELVSVLRGFKAIDNLRTLDIQAESFATSISDAQFRFSDNEYLQFLRNIKKLTYKFHSSQEILQRAATVWHLSSKVMTAVNQVIWAYGDPTLDWMWVDKEKDTVIPIASTERCQQVPQLESVLMT